MATNESTGEILQQEKLNSNSQSKRKILITAIIIAASLVVIAGVVLGIYFGVKNNKKNKKEYKEIKFDIYAIPLPDSDIKIESPHYLYEETFL